MESTEYHFGMIARVQETTVGFVIVIPLEFVKAWGLRHDSPLEVLPLSSTAEDSPEFVYASREMVLEAHERTRLEHDAVYRDLAQGPEGAGPPESPPVDRKKR